MTTRICKKCLETKPLDLFATSRTCKEGHRYACKACDAVRQKQYETSEVGKAKRAQYEAKDTTKADKRKWHLSNSYKLDCAAYNAMLTEQRNGCAICGTQVYDTSRPAFRLAIDHCHSTGTVRGLLCKNCNMGLGMFKDSPDTLARAIAYLNNYAVI